MKNPLSRSKASTFRRLAALALTAFITAIPSSGWKPAEDYARNDVRDSVLPVPARGAISGRPATKWEEGHISGNGRMGALVMGQPLNETIIFSHEKLFLPWEKPVQPVDTASHLQEIRRMFADGQYQKAADLVVEISKKEGYTHKRWTDPFIPAFDLRVIMDAAGEVKGYGRTVNFATGEASVGWKDDRGTFVRRLFISRPDNVAVLFLQGPGAGKLNCRIGLATRPTDALPGIDAEYWNPEEKFKEGIKDVAIEASVNRLTYRSSFKRAWPGGLQGYEGVANVTPKGGSAVVDGKEIVVKDADEVLVLVRIDVLNDGAGSALQEMEASLGRLAAKGFGSLLAPHAKVHGGIFGRVRLDKRSGRGSPDAHRDPDEGPGLGWENDHGDDELCERSSGHPAPSRGHRIG